MAAVAEIMFWVVAFGLEHVVILVFDLPTDAAIPHNRFDRGFEDLEIGDEGVFVELLTRVFSQDG
jgi:hypothetical protein